MLVLPLVHHPFSKHRAFEVRSFFIICADYLLLTCEAKAKGVYALRMAQRLTSFHLSRMERNEHQPRAD